MSHLDEPRFEPRDDYARVIEFLRNVNTCDVDERHRCIRERVQAIPNGGPFIMGNSMRVRCKRRATQEDMLCDDCRGRAPS